jgi:hypothetical protein
MLKSPFNDGGLKGGEFFIEFLLKSSLFGEWKYEGLERLGGVLLLAACMLLAIMAISICLQEKVEFMRHGCVFLLNLTAPLALAIKFRTDFPVACSQDFRYIAPVLVSAAYFLGIGVQRAARKGHKPAEAIIAASIAVFCLLSSAFLMSLGSYS